MYCTEKAVDCQHVITASQRDALMKIMARQFPGMMGQFLCSPGRSGLGTMLVKCFKTMGKIYYKKIVFVSN